MRIQFLLTLCLAVALLLAACLPAQAGAPSPVGTEIIQGTDNTRTARAPVKETSSVEVATQTPALTATQTGSVTQAPQVGSQITLMVNSTGSPPFLVDQQGRSLYAYMNDNQYGSASACMDDCAVEWPPVSVSEMPSAAEGVDPTMVGALNRTDNLTQATYNGWPLYYYNMDTIPGTTNGHSYNGVWFLISPSGDPIQQ